MHMKIDKLKKVTHQLAKKRRQWVLKGTTHGIWGPVFLGFEGNDCTEERASPCHFHIRLECTLIISLLHCLVLALPLQTGHLLPKQSRYCFQLFLLKSGSHIKQKTHATCFSGPDLIHLTQRSWFHLFSCSWQFPSLWLGKTPQSVRTMFSLSTPLLLRI